MNNQRPTKRARLEHTDISPAADIRFKRAAFVSSLSRPVSPPGPAKEHAQTQQQLTTLQSSTETVSQGYSCLQTRSKDSEHKTNGRDAVTANGLTITSPFQLTRVRGLSLKDNIDTVSLHEILGDPLIREAWIFNFCFDVNWTMRHFDADIRSLVKVKIVHGSWKREDANRQGIEDDIKMWSNVEDIKAYLPDLFGTHHSKMMILFKHDSTARVVIHTANMLEKDWDHMTQAVWQSPALPLCTQDCQSDGSNDAFGSGFRFKADLLRYFRCYGKKLVPLSDQISRYDFSSVRAALISSVPSRVKVSNPSNRVWGHLLLRHALREIASAHSLTRSSTPTTSHLVSQISSIATLPQNYLQETLYKAASPATTSIIFPTPSDLQTALTGYATGGSIHTKIATAGNQKQVSLLRPQLHRWGSRSLNMDTRAGRNMIPPHIKTYINFASKPTADNPTPDIRWALLSSANLSQQAWGTIPKVPPKSNQESAEKEVHIQSYEIGVLVWPELYHDSLEDETDDLDVIPQRTIVKMVPVFGKDKPQEIKKLQQQDLREILVGLRMPYDLPLTPYGADEMPWSPGETHIEPDRLGQTWP